MSPSLNLEELSAVCVCVMELFLSAPCSYRITAPESALWQGVVNDVNISLRLKYAKEFILLKLRSDCPLFPCFSESFHMNDTVLGWKETGMDG